MTAHLPWYTARSRPTEACSRPRPHRRDCFSIVGRPSCSRPTTRCASASTTPRSRSPRDSVLVLGGAGPVGVPGMPEWGHVPVPARLAAAGVDDMVRVTDGRMSGTAFGTCVLHVTPEAAIGGPLALVRDGDHVALDVHAGTLELEVSADELAERRARWQPASARAPARLAGALPAARDPGRRGL